MALSQLDQGPSGCGFISTIQNNHGLACMSANLTAAGRLACAGGLVDTVKEGVTGFHMGLLDPDALVDKDAEAVADCIARYVCPFPPLNP